MLTITDGYAGWGGSMTGAESVPGIRGRYALNHWDLAIATHNANFPHVDHDRVDLTDEHDGDPHKYEPTDILWMSPECTTWSQARGQTRDYDVKQLDLLEEEPEVAEAVARSRFQMETVIIFARCHPYKGIVVENVPDILKWSGLDTWLDHLHKLGYQHKTITLNSAFAHQLGAPAPQLRDRVYFVFWQSRYTRPDFDKWLRPDAWCPTCDTVVRAIKVDKPGKRRPMRYNAQYYYRCPSATCRNAVVHPLVLPARAAIDWSIVGERIGDRKRPLADATRRRIAAGLARYGQPIHLEVAGNTFERRPGVRSWPVDQPYRTFHTTQSRALAGPPMMVPTGGTWNDDATTADEPLRTRTTREAEAIVYPPFVTVLRSGRPRNLDPQADPMATVVADGSGHALVVPTESRTAQRARTVDDPIRTLTARHTDALVVPLRNNGVARPADAHPLPTVAAAGTHHALVMRNNNSRGNQQGHMCTPVDEPVRTLTTAGHQSLLEWGTPPGALYAYDTGIMRPLGLPMPTQTSTSGDALITPGQAELAVDDCWLRMLTVREIAAGMAFRDGFLMPYGAKRDQVRGLGNAVTPPAARDILAMLAEAITGDVIDPVGRLVAA